MITREKLAAVLVERCGEYGNAQAIDALEAIVSEARDEAIEECALRTEGEHRRDGENCSDRFNKHPEQGTTLAHFGSLCGRCKYADAIRTLKRKRGSDENQIAATQRGRRSPATLGSGCKMSDMLSELAVTHEEWRKDRKLLDHARARVAELEWERDLAWSSHLKQVDGLRDERDAAIKERDEAIASNERFDKSLNDACSELNELERRVIAVEKERDEARAALSGLKECCASVSELLEWLREQENCSVELANKSKPVKYARETTLRDAITDAPNPEK